MRASHRRFTSCSLDRLVARERLEDNNNNKNNEFVLVSFRRHVHVVGYRRACVEEDQREGGQAGRENVARFRVLKKGENERGLHGR